MRGCLAVALLPVAGVLLGASFLMTFEADRPQDFPGLHDNDSGPALAVLLLAALATVGALLAAKGTGRALLVPVAVVCVLLLAGAGWRAWTLAPVWECAGHDAVARSPGGAWSCHDR